ncbi:hypothetical protein DYB28_002591 [Aphanomyces astaci]|uniref:Cyclin-dependent kinase 2 homolog n=1 Tax=Aphanomyces astaci TaxID=112090 RepID=A0A9X8H438_APHAT|nr:hypothetical protein DYB28_002591 [Aphanomyces astaci]
MHLYYPDLFSSLLRRHLHPAAMSLGLPNHGWSDACIDVYEKIECIGAGTYGQVFLASHRDTGEKVALKKIRSLNEVQGLPVTTIREIKVLKAIKHRNVVGLREVIVTNELDMGDLDDDPDADIPAAGGGPVPMDFSCGCIYLVLEYVDHDLTGLLDRQYPFTDVEIKSIMMQLMDVMKYMHATDVIHRDIKCSNLLLTPQHLLKVADFGLARSTLGELPFTNKKLATGMANVTIRVVDSNRLRETYTAQDVGFCVAAGGKSSPLVVGHEKSLMEFAKKVHPSALTFRVERFKDARQSISPSPATEQQPGGTAEQALG